MNRSLIVYGCWIALLATPYQVAVAQERSPTLSVVGEATVYVPPELALIRLAVITESEDAIEASSENNKKINSVIDALTSAGVPADNISTLKFSIYPLRMSIRKDDSSIIPAVRYRVENEVLIKTTSIQNVGDLIGAAIAGGANQVSSLHYVVEDVKEHRAKAITNAAKVARSEAATLAAATGVRLVDIERIDLSPSRSYGIFQQEQSSVPPIVPGSVEVRARVTITYRIESIGD